MKEPALWWITGLARASLFPMGKPGIWRILPTPSASFWWALHTVVNRDGVEWVPSRQEVLASIPSRRTYMPQ